MNNIVEQGVLAYLDGLPRRSVSVVITDPPYGLEFMGKSWDKGWHDGKEFEEWVEQWAEKMLRVVKPGAHGIFFGGTRMVHRLTSGLENAGWEIRDQLMWAYLSGYPKATDMGKAIDKRTIRDPQTGLFVFRNDEIRHICRYIRAAIDAHPTHTTRSLGEYFGFHPRMIDHWAARDSDSQPTVPTWDQWVKLKEQLGLEREDPMDEEVERLNKRKGEPGEAWFEREKIGTMITKDAREGDVYAPGAGDYIRIEVDITAPATDLATQWAGWKTGLKPAYEPIVLARAPMKSTAVVNVVKNGTGALNIEACRLEGDDDIERYPSNLMITDPGMFGPEADKLFLVPKADTSERFGFCRMCGQVYPQSEHTKHSVHGAEIHPTVKPLALMRHLVRLLTPPGGVILDPFMGTGTTAVAAKMEGFNFLGCDLTPEYVEVANYRVDRTLTNRRLDQWL